MKELLCRYATYNHWANRLLANCLSGLDEEVIKTDITSSFPGIYPTLLHLWNAESVWWQRVKMVEHPEGPAVYFSGTGAELCKKWLEQSQLWEDWVLHATEAALQHAFIYHTTKKEQFKQSVSDVLIHLFNHQSYHRGQIVTMLRQSCVNNIPGMDYITFCRKLK